MIKTKFYMRTKNVIPAKRVYEEISSLGVDVKILRETMEYRNSRPLIKLDKKTVLWIAAILELVFKGFIVYKLL